MVDQFARLNEEHLMFLAGMGAIVGVFSTIIATVVAVQVRKFRQRQLELGFRDDLLRRGLSVDQAIRLIACHRPTWSQSLMSVGEWGMQKLSVGWNHVEQTIPGLLRRGRTGIRIAARHTLQFSRILFREGRVLWRTALRQGQQLCRNLWRETRPVLQSSMRTLSRCLHWLGDQTQQAVRRLAPHRP